MQWDDDKYTEIFIIIIVRPASNGAAPLIQRSRIRRGKACISVVGDGFMSVARKDTFS